MSRIIITQRDLGQSSGFIHDGGSIFLLLQKSCIFFPVHLMNAHDFKFQPCLKNYQSVDIVHLVSEGAHFAFFYFY